MQHPAILLDLMRQRHSHSLLEAERRRLRRTASEAPGRNRRPAVSLILEVQLPRGRRVRLSL